MTYTKEDLYAFFLAGRRRGLSEGNENTTMDFDKFFEVYTTLHESLLKETAGENNIENKQTL